MFGLGVPELAVLGVVALLLVARASGRGGAVAGSVALGPELVLRRFHIDSTGASPSPVEIVGRSKGIQAWFLTVIGLDAETRLILTHDEVSYRSASLYGETTRVVPLPCVASTHCGYSKPISYLIVGAVVAVGGVVLGLSQHQNAIVWVGLGLGGVLAVAYVLSKKIMVSVETAGGMLFGLQFKRSVIENVAIDIQQAREAIRVINAAVTTMRGATGS